MIEFVNSHSEIILYVVRVYLIIVFCVYLWAYLAIPWGAPWLPSSFSTIHQILKMAKIKPGELLVDMGAGEGKI